MNANEQTVISTARANGMPERLAELMLAQAKHESANFTSAVFKDCNNAFGYSSIAGGPSCPGHSFYKSYYNLADSTKEICNWIKRRQAEGKFPKDLNTIQTPEQYAALLKGAAYYEDAQSNYAAGLKRWFITNLFPISSGLILLILAALAYIIHTGNERYLR